MEKDYNIFLHFSSGEIKGFNEKCDNMLSQVEQIRNVFQGKEDSAKNVSQINQKLKSALSRCELLDLERIKLEKKVKEQINELGILTVLLKEAEDHLQKEKNNFGVLENKHKKINELVNKFIYAIVSNVVMANNFISSRALASIIHEIKLIDRVWYLEQNKDVAAAGMDPVEHYILYGAKEGRAPCPLFK